MSKAQKTIVPGVCVMEEKVKNTDGNQYIVCVLEEKIKSTDLHNSKSLCNRRKC